MGKSLAELTAEIREINVEHGWRPAAGGPGTNTFGDYIALLHSEVSEALEAYRDHRLADATDWLCNHQGCPRYGRVPSATDCSQKPNRAGHRTVYGKPEGVGSELADVLIRLLDMCDVFGIVPFDMDCEIADVEPLDVPDFAVSFGDHLSWLHYRISQIDPVPAGRRFDAGDMSFTLRALVAVAERHGIDLPAEVERKIAYNRTRPFRHGGRHL